MRLNLQFLCAVIMGMSGWCGHSMAQAAALNPRFGISLEIGSGAIVGIQAHYNLNRIFGVGIGSGFDYGQEKIGEEKYSSLLFNENVFTVVHFLNNPRFILDARIRLGYDYLKVGKFARHVYDITPDLLLGYRDVYFIASGCVLFLNEAVFVPSIGLGYRFNIK